MSIINHQDWRLLGKEFQAGTPFPSICIDNFLDADFASTLVGAHPKYIEAKSLGREFQSINENVKVQITDPDIFPNPFKQLCEDLSSPYFIENLSQMTGIKDLVWDPTFRGGGIHTTGSSGLLDVHVDFNYEKKLNLYRRVNILIYLNLGWQNEWGGKVELWDKNVKNCIHSFLPIHNRCVIFATSDYSFHGVTAVTSPQGVSRNSFAAYYYSKEAGNNRGEIYGGNHSTIFKARPNEKLKKYWSMPLVKAKRSVKSITRNCKEYLKKVLR
jgi:hypothetical protein